MARHRKHKNGDHRECLPEHCPEVAGSEPSNALHQDSDRPGRDEVPGPRELTEEEEMLAELAEYEARQAADPAA